MVPIKNKIKAIVPEKNKKRFWRKKYRALYSTWSLKCEKLQGHEVSAMKII